MRCKGRFRKTSIKSGLWRDWRIDFVVTKESGAVGGYQAKADAAAAVGIPLIVVQRPPMFYPFVVATFAAVQAQLSDWDLVAAMKDK